MTKQIKQTKYSETPKRYTQERVDIHNEIISEFTNHVITAPDKYGFEEITRLIDKQRNNPKFFTADDSKCLLLYLREYYMTPLSRNDYLLERSQ